MRQIAIISSFLITISFQAGAFCSEPSVYMSTPSKPSVPFCVNEWANTHTCDEWEIQSYYDDLEFYASQAQELINALNIYVSEASEYAQCRARELE